VSTDEALPLTEHLAELRSRIIKIAIGWAVGCAAAWSFKEQIFGYLLAPAVAALSPEQPKLQAIAPTEIFFTYVKCAMLAGFILSLPVWFWQIWSFVAPGLYPNEKKAIVPFVLCSSLLFAGGAIFGYSIVFPLMFDFLTDFDSEFVVSAWTMREVFSLTSRMFLVFGVAFELPLFIFFLSVAGIVDAKTLLRWTPYAVLGVFIVGAILTPPDPVSQVFLAIPLLGLYLLGVGAAFLFGGRRRTTEEEEEDATETLPASSAGE
jgi:sec-independent protein translocase protein TatC